MQKKNQSVIVWVIIIFVIAVAASFLVPNKSKTQDVAGAQALAQCLKDKGAKFYGAFWCTHCKSQKEAFGSAQKTLPYIECSTPDGKGQTQQCKDANIEGYPTWVFPDGSTQSGEVSLKTLAEKTGCQFNQ